MAESTGEDPASDLRVAFVNQAIDRVLPPLQNSVGGCTWGLGGALAEHADVTVYGRRNATRRRRPKPKHTAACASAS